MIHIVSFTIPNTTEERFHVKVGDDMHRGLRNSAATEEQLRTLLHTMGYTDAKIEDAIADARERR
jgi:hypothetical protein